MTLMIRNGFLFNLSGTPMNLAGSELQRLFDKKWKNLLLLREASEEEGEDDDESEEDHRCMWLLNSFITATLFHGFAFAGAISLMENQIKVMNENLTAFKSAKLPKKEKKKKEKKEKGPVVPPSLDLNNLRRF